MVIIALINLKKTDEIVLMKDKVEYIIKSLPAKLQSHSLFGQYVSVMNNYIGYQLRLFNIEEGIRCSENIKTIVQKHGNTENLIVFYANFFTLFFYKEDYHKALYYINKILTMNKTEVREDVFNEIKMLNIIVHYELGNEDMLPVLCKSIRNDLEKKGPLNKAEKLLLDFFSKTIVKTSTRKEKVIAFSELKKELVPVMSDSSEQKIVYSFDVIAWLESKIKNRPFAEIVKVKALQIQKN